jgi:hypothetical protein
VGARGRVSAEGRASGSYEPEAAEGGMPHPHRTGAGRGATRTPPRLGCAEGLVSGRGRGELRAVSHS